MQADSSESAIRSYLERRRAELQQRADRVRADLRRTNEPLSPDFAEQVTQRENDEVLGAIGDAARSEIAQIDRALQRLAAGEYRVCAACGNDIAPDRLAAVPYTTYCGACAR